METEIEKQKTEDIEITGKIRNVIFRGDDGFLIANFISKNKSVSILGNIYNPDENEEYRLKGSYSIHPTFGRQFNFRTFETVEPHSIIGIHRYINKLDGIGPKIADKLIDAFGSKTLHFLRTKPEIVSEKIKNISIDKANEIKKILNEKKEIEQSQIQLEEYFSVKGSRIPKKTIGELIEKFQSNAFRIIKKNPYLLTKNDGIGFISADIIAMYHKYDPNHIQRKMAAIEYVLRENSKNGHTWMKLGEMKEKTAELVSANRIDEALIELQNNSELIRKNDLVTTKKYYVFETFIAKKINELTKNNIISLEDTEQTQQTQQISRKSSVDIISLNKDQRSAFHMFVENKISIITGGPGTGKTYIVSKIIEYAQIKKLSFALSAPTGKAAKRIFETTKYQASTIHKLLGYRPTKGNKNNFNHNEKNTLPFDIIVIDEFSMVTTELFYHFLKAVRLKTKILIVGDDFQLPSVGPGSLLKDFIDSKKIPITNLLEIIRNTGKIVEACEKIRKGEMYSLYENLNLNTKNKINIIHREIYSTDRILEFIPNLIEKISKKYEYDPLWDIQVISPVNENGDLSCKKINEILVKKLNKNRNPKEKHVFAVGDKVIQTKNENKVTEIPGPNDLWKTKKTYIVNGDMGIISEIRKNVYIVDFVNPDKRVMINVFKNDLKLAYCLTCHKFQGSEVKAIIIPINQQFTYFLTRRWLYTAISRAQDVCITLGQFSAIKTTIKKNDKINRLTRQLYEINNYKENEIEI